MEVHQPVKGQVLRILPKCSRTLLMQPLADKDHDKVMDLIRDAAERADNMGIDEINEEVLDLILSFGSGWTFHNPTFPERMEAVLFIAACRFSRSQHRTLCSLFIITNSSLSSIAGRGDILDVALEIVPQLHRGYSACILEVFVTCTEHLLGYERNGFVITCVIPRAGQLTGQKGFVNSYILYKRLSCDELPVPLDIKSHRLKGLDTFTPTLGPLPSFLPAEHRLSNGMVVIVRAMTLEEVPQFYQVLVEAARHGQGYGLDELTDYQYFLRWYVHNFYNLTIQEKDGQRRIVGFQNFGRSYYSRSWTSSYLSDGNNVLMPEFRGGGIGAEISDFNGAVAVDLGFGSAFGDTCVENLSSLIGMGRVGYINTGVIPRAIFFENRGWLSLVTIHKPYDENMKKLCEDWKKRSTASKL